MHSNQLFILHKNQLKSLTTSLNFTKKIPKQTEENIQKFFESLLKECENLEQTFLKNYSKLESKLKSCQDQIETKEKKVILLKSEVSKLKSEVTRVNEEEKTSKNLKNSNFGTFKSENIKTDKIKTKFFNKRQKFMKKSQSKQEIFSEENKKLLAEIEKLKSVIKTQENRIKDLEEKIKDDEDSLDLNFNSIKDALEIQELREALRTISEKYETDKENLLKDCEECRKDMEVQIFRLKQEKAYSESICKDIQKHLTEVSKEKELMEREIFSLNQQLERNYILRALTPAQKSETDYFSNSELEFTYSLEIIEKSNTMPSKSFQETFNEKLNEISLDIQKTETLSHDAINTIHFLKHTLGHMLSIKEMIDEEVSANKNFKKVSLNLSDIFSKLKQRIKTIEDESVILNKKMDESDYQPRIQTEPCINHSDRNSKELLFYYKKQLQIEKAKVLEKKHVIKLHKEQILFLKKNLRDLQNEGKTKNLTNDEYFKEIFKNFIREVPFFPENIENKLSVLFKFLQFSTNEAKCILEERKTKKIKPSIFGIFS